MSWIMSWPYTRNHPTKVCLNMIVKNEADSIESTLMSVSEHISSWIICDTGSTDGTQQVVKNYFKKIRMAGHLAQHTWKDFSYNRNKCLREGEKKLTCDYWVVLDADQPLIALGAKLYNSRLTKDMYLLEERAKDTVFRNPRVLKASIPWEYESPVHERIVPPKSLGRSPTVGHVSKKIYTLHESREHRDSAKDIKLMLEYLEKRPDDTRIMLHVAKAYFGIMNNLTEGLRYFYKVVESNPDPETLFYCKYQMANIFNNAFAMENPPKELLELAHSLSLINNTQLTSQDVFSAYEQVSLAFPDRNEPYCSLARFSVQQLGNIDWCMQFAMLGIEKGRVRDTHLLPDADAEHCAFEMACICGGVGGGNSKEGKHACNYLLEEFKYTDGVEWKDKIKMNAIKYIAMYDK